ncbi:MAG: nucleotidyltransferase family protein [Nitrososphaerota archaeon]|nr:nucleotidyltransferase family protein [Nitrososphaerota archaeon]MDG7023285.1 nucleotidyltransferase family protein [Nitrososphaerota archaeon]
MTGKTVSLVVLAAGLSSRFGRNKLLEPMGSTTLVGHVVTEALGSKASQVVVVGGHEFGRLKEALRGHGCKLVYNPEFRQGQSSSVKKGLSGTAPGTDAAMVLPGDMAMTHRTIIDAVIDEYSKSGARIVCAGFGGRQGHPILFDKTLFGELQGIDEETRGLKKVVSAHASEIRVVETSPAALFDLDTPDDLRRLE